LVASDLGGFERKFWGACFPRDDYWAKPDTEGILIKHQKALVLPLLSEISGAEFAFQHRKLPG